MCLWLLPLVYTAPDSPPSNFVAVALSSRSIRLTWGAPPAEYQNGVITGYVVNVTELGTEEVTVVSTESLNLTLYSLRPFARYIFLVTAQTVAGSGPATHLLSVTTPEEGINCSTFIRIFRVKFLRTGTFRLLLKQTCKSNLGYCLMA